MSKKSFCRPNEELSSWLLLYWFGPSWYTSSEMEDTNLHGDALHTPVLLDKWKVRSEKAFKDILDEEREHNKGNKRNNF